MPEPRIQYARTSDGVSIAYAVHGDGPPLIFMQGYPFNHLKAALQLESIRVFFEQLARRCTLVRFDHRATGLSQRGRLPASQDNLLADLVAVVSAVGLRPVSLVGLGFGGAIAVRFAVRYPQAVSRLAVGDMSVRPSSSYPGVNRLRAVTDLATADWEIATETLASVMYGWGEAQAREAAAYLRECTSPEAVESMWDLTEDLTDLHRQVRVPTLVFWHKDIAFPPNEAMVELTSLIDGAELAMLEGTWISTEERASDLAEIVLDFICASEQNAAPQSAPEPSESSGIHTIFFTDIEGSTALTERLGDARVQELRRAHDTIVREALKGCGGSETKHTGDGIMASFPSASRAIECAVAVQRAIAERGDATLRVRIGLNAGEPVAEEADLFGTAVNLARRICDKAEPGQILVSDVVHQLAAGKGFSFADNGEATLKGFEKPVRLHEVRWRDD